MPPDNLLLQASVDKVLAPDRWGAIEGGHHAQQVRYDQLHSHFVPESDRRSLKYAGYGLMISTETIRSFCELLD